MLERTRHYETVGKSDLTPRQREVLALISAGKTNPEIAEKLGITLDGAKFHVREILAKLEVESREEAAEWWRRERRLGKRVASFFRALAPAGWLKPTAAVTAIGGTTLGLVAVGFAMNGGGESASPDCELADLQMEANGQPPSGDNAQFSLKMWSSRDCRLEGIAVASLYPPDPNLGLDWSQSTPGRLSSTF
ncbi:MAG: response regulator transcription factor [Dehalococcoidia bacterium]